jgi:hypothetical protein
MTTSFKSRTGLADILDMQQARAKNMNLNDYFAELHNVVGDNDANLAIQSAQVTIPVASVKTLFATPVTLIAAPATGFAVVPIFAQFFLDFATTGYDAVGSGDDLVLKYTNASGTTIMTVESTGFLDATADKTAFGFPPASYVATPAAAVVAHILTGEIFSAAGDSPLLAKVWYRVLPVALS